MALWAILVAAASAGPPTPAPLPAEVDAVEVTARRPVVGELKEGVQAYRPEFFTAVRPGTAMDMIRWLPGFTFEDTRDVRGLGGAIGNVLIDGQPPTSKTDTLATVLARIPASQVDRVDIILGGAPGIDMRGRPVLANVVLKKGGAPAGSVAGSARLHRAGRVAAEFLASGTRKTANTTSEASLTLSERVFQGVLFGEGPLIRRDSLGRVLFRAEEDSRGGGPMAILTASHERPLESGKLRLNGSYRIYKGELHDQIRIIEPAGRQQVDLIDEYAQGELGARYDRTSGRSTSETQLLWRRTDHESFNDNDRPPRSSVLESNNVQHEAVFRTTLRFKRDDQLTLESAAEFARNTMKVRSELTINSVPTPLPTANVDVRENRGEIGSTLSWKSSAAVALTGALKIETSSLRAGGDVELSRNLTYVKPRLTLSWTPNPKIQVRLRAEHEVNQINFFNYVAFTEFTNGAVRAGNPELLPRRAWVAEAVVERQFWAGASLVATARDTAIRDAVDSKFVPDFGGATIIGNIGGGRRLDLIGTLTMPLARFGLDGVTVKGTLNYTPMKVDDPTTGERRQVSGQPLWSWDAHLAHDLPRWKLNWGVDAVYGGPYALYRPSSVEEVDGSLNLTVFVEYRPRTDLNLRLEVGNAASMRPSLVVRVHEGPRHVFPLAFEDSKSLADGPNVMFRVRKTLN